MAKRRGIYDYVTHYCDSAENPLRCARSAMNRLALYARVSTSEQSPESQLHALRIYAATRGLEAVGPYVDHGVSGAEAHRPALDGLLKDARLHQFDGVACVKLDRLARSVHHLIMLAGEFERLGIDLVVLDQAIDTSTSTGRFTFHILSAVAELERELIRERVCAGLAAARRRGKHIGRPAKLSASDRARLDRLWRAGRKQIEIARLLGVSCTTVRRELARLRGA